MERVAMTLQYWESVLIQGHSGDQSSVYEAL